MVDIHNHQTRITRRTAAAAVGAGLAAGAWPLSFAQATGGRKVLRYAFEVAETGLDPAQLFDLYSRILTAHIYEGLYGYDPLARPVKIVPLTAAAMPEISSDFREWTIRLRPGIYFADDPAFKGQRRELVAQDYVYMLKRFADPANKSPAWGDIELSNYLGLNELHRRAVETRKPFDYDREIDGVRAIDRYTLRLRVAQPLPRLIEMWANSDLFGAVAREVIEFYRDKIVEHPVGTGPFKLAEWRRSSFIAFERNPNYRERVYEAQPAADDTEGQAILARFKGRKLPMIDRVEVSIIEEQQPRWLAFLNDESDFMYRVGTEFIDVAMPGGKLAPNLSKRGMQPYRVVEAEGTYLFFNMEDATVGGYTPEKVALRRAVALAMDTQREIQVVWKNGAILSQSAVPPNVTGYDPKFRSDMSVYDPARAMALLDLYGYIDRDGDGWREMPNGAPLMLRMASQADQRSRGREELMKKNMDAIGLRMQIDVMQWPEALKSARAGTLAMWTLAGLAAGPDPYDMLSRYESGQIGGQNFARFRMPRVDAMLAQVKSMPDGPERLALIDEINKVGIAYMPYKFRVHRAFTDMAQPWLVGYRRPVFWLDWWHTVDIDLAARASRRRA